MAHPDDETLWAGGLILSHPAWKWYILSLCRASDPDRAPKFYRALNELGAAGAMGDLDDGPEQSALDAQQVERAVLGFLPATRFALVITHDPAGEYTRHLRHEEAGRAVIQLWNAGRLSAGELWTFAYDDGGKQHLPRPIESASIQISLPEDIWQRKHGIITQTYGFPPDGFEAQTTPRLEAFWRFASPPEARAWLEKHGGRV